DFFGIVVIVGRIRMHKKFIEFFADKIADLIGPFFKKDVHYIIIVPIARSAKNGLGIGIGFGGVKKDLGAAYFPSFHISGQGLGGFYDIFLGVTNTLPHSEQFVQFPCIVFIGVVPIAIGTVQEIEHGTGAPYFAYHGLKVANGMALQAINIFIQKARTIIDFQFRNQVIAPKKAEAIPKVVV